MTQTVWLARHGNRLDFVKPQWLIAAERHYDPPLSTDGVLQAKALGERLKKEKIAHIFASPFFRTAETAYYVAEALDLPIKIETGVSEFIYFRWMPDVPKILSADDLAELFPQIDRSYTSRIPVSYPETFAQAIARSQATAKRLTEEFSGDILIIGHAASIAGAARGLVDNSPKIRTPLCGLTKIVRQGSDWQMEFNGDISHLSAVADKTPPWIVNLRMGLWRLGMVASFFYFKVKKGHRV
jgi:broad specificity phosphatase PhoE